MIPQLAPDRPRRAARPVSGCSARAGRNPAGDRDALERQRDFDWVDEQALSSVLTLEGGGLKNRSGQLYGAIVVPGAKAISRAALDRLHAFANAGGSEPLAGVVSKGDTVRVPLVLAGHESRFTVVAPVPSGSSPSH